MLADIVGLFCAILAPVFLGFLAVGAILKSEPVHFFERFALSYGAGLGLLSFIMFLFSLTGLRFSVFTISVCLIASMILFFRANSKNVGFNLNSDLLTRKISFYEIIFFVFVILMFLHVLLSSLALPLDYWDSWAIYGFKAKAIYFTKTVPIDFFSDHTKAYANLDYPLLLPLVESWIYMAISSWNDQIVKIIFPLYFLSFVIVFYFSLRCFAAKKFSMFFTLLLLTIPYFTENVSFALSDFIFMFYYFVGLIFLVRGYTLGNIRFFYLSALFSGLAAWTKNEGTVVCLFNILLALWLMKSTSKKFDARLIKSFLIYIFLSLLFIVPWLSFKIALNLSNWAFNERNLNYAYVVSNFDRLPIIIGWIFKTMLLYRLYNFVWILYFFVIILNISKLKLAPYGSIFLSIAFYISVWVFVYIITPFDLIWTMSTSGDRLLLHVSPIALFLCALLLNHKGKGRL